MVLHCKKHNFTKFYSYFLQKTVILPNVTVLLRDFSHIFESCQFKKKHLQEKQENVILQENSF